jgi:hypothetical protein
MHDCAYRRLAVAFIIGAIAVGIGAAAAGCGSNATPSASPTKHHVLSAAERARRLRARQAAERQARAQLVLAQRRSDAAAAGGSLESYDGADFSVDYPAAWTVNTSSSAGYHDTTIESGDGVHLIRVDMNDVAPSTNSEALAAPVEKGLEGQPGYRLIGWAPMTFNGYPALRWEFVVSENGTLLRKVDTFFVDNSGAAVAILVQAPAAGYEFWAPVFRSIRESLVMNDGGSAGSESYAAPSTGGDSYSSPSTDSPDFCASHICISNFDNGSGYIVQCADGEWSHSGGEPGACSYHGGETGNIYGGSDSSGAYPLPSAPSAPSGPVIGPGNGYAVTCADGSVSNSGGIQGACSHHGGVSP